MCTYNLAKQEDWKIPYYTFGKELRKNLAIYEESLKYYNLINIINKKLILLVSPLSARESS